MPDSAVFTVSRDSDPAIREELERILRSRTFVHSHRIRRFLQFVVEEYLGARQHRLKEYLIGLEVFGRPESFDPRVDSIVRVEARRLRAKLDEYYASEGGEAVLRIQLRKGSYVPLFEAGSVARRTANRSWRPSLTITSLVADNGDVAFAEEIQRRLLQHLSAEPALRVMASGTSDYILQGAVETVNGQQRMFFQLMNVAEHAWEWSQWIEFTPRELSTLCARAAHSIWHAIAGTRNDERPEHSRNQDSLAAYLQGRYLWGSPKPQGFTASVPFFTRAVETDPDYASAWAGLAEALVASSLFDRGDAPENRARALQAANRAVELDDALPESRLAMAAVRSFFEWKWDEGEKEFESAICFNPTGGRTRLLYGLQLACRGRMEHARAELDEAERLSPVSLPVQFAQGWLSSLAGVYEDAMRRYRLIALLEPDSPWSYLGLGQACAAQQRWPEAIAHFTNVSHLLNGRFLYSGCLGYCYAKSGRREEAMQLLRRLPESAAPSVNFASIYAGLGDFQRAFACLQQAVQARETCLPFLLAGPEFNTLRGEPQYRALKSVMGLAAPVASAA